jgi:ribonuclease HI
VTEPDVTTVYTDGACAGNPGPGGWAWAEPGAAWASGFAEHTTNQRMEITAAYEAVRSHPGPVRIVTDSTYVMNCFEKRWYVNWLANGWKNSQRKPVANKDLWEPFVELYEARPGEIAFQWVKGHSDDPMNDLVDRLAVEACVTQTAGAGEEPPDPASLGPADAPQVGVVASGPTARDGRVPEGHRLVVFGAAPPELGGWEANTVAADVRRRLAELLAAKAQLHPDLVVLTGLRLGAEMLAAEAALDAGVPYVAILPYPEPDRPWSAENRKRFAELVEAARSVVTLEKKRPESRADFRNALARRDGWLIANVDEAVLVGDDDDRSLADLHRKLVKRLGEEEVWVLAPY